MPVPTLSAALAARSLTLSVQGSALADGQPPEWFMVVPAGTVKGVDGRGPYTLKDPAKVIAQTKQGVWPKPIDYNHQTVFACLNGGEAPAAAWITDLEPRDGAIWAKVEWTDRGAQAVSSREYRFISPALQHDKAGEIQCIHSVGLVNTPNIAELPAIASQTGDTKAMDELLQALREALGLSADADQAAIISACKSNCSANASLLAPLATTLKLAANASAKEVVTAAQAALSAVGAPDPAKFVPMAAFAELQGQVAALTKHQADNKADLAVNAAMQAGKVPPSLKDWALTYAAQNPDGFAEWVSKAPAIVKPGGSGLAGAGDPPGTGAAVDDTALAVCTALGISVEDYKKTAGEASR